MTGYPYNAPKNSSEWIDWHGGECPVADDTIVAVKYRGGSERGSTLAQARWFKIGSDWWRHQSPNRTNDIIAYCLPSPTPEG